MEFDCYLHRKKCVKTGSIRSSAHYIRLKLDDADSIPSDDVVAALRLLLDFIDVILALSYTCSSVILMSS